jgi:benzodiazapine receptor
MTTSPARPGHQRLAALAGFVTICLAAGLLGSLATAPQIPTWYGTLNKPSWNPPSWVFAPVWTTLYVMMGVAGWLVWKKLDSARGLLFRWFWLQLALNTIWPFVFFGLKQPGWAFAEIVLLWLAIAATLAAFHRTSGTAAVLLIPYLGWVSFAAYLNFTIWQLNR